MSLKTWQERFYPVDASDPSLDTTFKKIEHSIEKWCGLKPENLSAHGLKMAGRDIMPREDGDDVFNLPRFEVVSGATCALCEAFYDAKGDGDEGNMITECFDCPLFKQGNGCEATRNSPYWQSRESGDPSAILKALEEARERELARLEEIASAKHTAQMLDLAEDEGECNSIMREATQ
jgi:hypothetical protein